LISSAYFRFAISGPGFLNRLLAVHKGIGAKHVNVADMRDALVPIPPLAEQHRIVAKIDELMALCDRLETRQSDAQAAHARLVDELLGSLLQARDAEDFSASWERLAGCFEAVFSTEESVEILASAIRKFAFSGKISSHRQEGKWTASKLKYAVSFLNGYAFKSEWFLRQGIKLARNINISHGNIDWTEMACIDADQAKEFKNFELKVGDILLSLDRPLISTGLKVAVVSENDLPCLLLQRVAKIIPSEDKIVPEFLLHWLHSPFFMNEIDPGRSNGVPHISTKQVGNMDLLLPPLEEQRRIVAKLDEILALCDRLKVGIRQARQMQERLVGTLVERAVL
jgi:type I restriction enzyme S subunit